MKITIIAFFSCLLVLCARGQSDMRGSCKCSGSDWFRGRVHKKIIRAGPFIHQPSVFCPRIEITFITTVGKEKCLNPNSQAGQLILRNSEKIQKKMMTRAESRSTVTAWPQTNTQSSASLQTSTKL